MNLEISTKVWVKGLTNGLLKLVEQGPTIILLVVGLVYFVNSSNKNMENLIHYLEDDRKEVLHALGEFKDTNQRRTKAIEEQNELIRELLIKR